MRTTLKTVLVAAALVVVTSNSGFTRLELYLGEDGLAV